MLRRRKRGVPSASTQHGAHLGLRDGRGRRPALCVLLSQPDDLHAPRVDEVACKDWVGAALSNGAGLTGVGAGTWRRRGRVSAPLARSRLGGAYNTCARRPPRRCAAAARRPPARGRWRGRR